MLQSTEMDPRIKLKDQLTDPSSDPVILINYFDVDPSSAEAFNAAWEKVSKSQFNFLSAQLHKGIGNSRMFLNYAVFENTAAFAATMTEPNFEELRALYPDGVTARPHLFRRVNMPGICAGQV